MKSNVRQLIIFTLYNDNLTDTLQDKTEITEENGAYNDKKNTKKADPAKRHMKEKATDVKTSWPQNRMVDCKPSTSKSQTELFPFEKL